MRRRDPETAKPLKELFKQLDRFSGLSSWTEEHTELALVLADGLLQNGFQAVGNDLSRFAKRMQKWADSSRAQHGWVKWDHPGLPKWKQWEVITDRAQDAIRQIEQRAASERAWHQRRPHMATVVLRHRISGPDSIRGPYAITPADAEDLPSLRKWLIKKRFPALGRLRQDWKHRGGAEKYDYGYVELHREGDKVTLYPLKGWHSVTIELGRSRHHLAGRAVAKMTEMLQRKNYLRPALYARRLHRAGVTPSKLESELRAVTIRGSTSELDERFNLRRTAAHVY